MSVTNIGGGAVLNSGIAAPALTLKAVGSQTANLQEWQDQNGTVTTKVSAGGLFTAMYATIGPLTSQPGPTLTVKPPSNGIYNLQEWQNGSSSVLAKVDYAGNFTAASIIKTGGTSSQFLKADGSVDSNTYSTTANINDSNIMHIMQAY